MLAEALARHDPRNRGKRPRQGVAIEVDEWLDVGELAVFTHRFEERQGVPDPGRGGARWHGRACEHVVGAVGLLALGYEVAPADAGLVEQVGEVRPGIFGRGVEAKPARAARARAI